MKNTMTAYDFVNWFANSESRKDQFSRAALFALFDYYEEMEADTGEEVEFDPIAFCCEWSEYLTAVEAVEDMGCDYGDDPELDDDDRMTAAQDYLRDNTQVIEFDGGILVAQF